MLANFQDVDQSSMARISTLRRQSSVGLVLMAPAVCLRFWVSGI